MFGLHPTITVKGMLLRTGKQPKIETLRSMNDSCRERVIANLKKQRTYSTDCRPVVTVDGVRKPMSTEIRLLPSAINAVTKLRESNSRLDAYMYGLFYPTIIAVSDTKLEHEYRDLVKKPINVRYSKTKNRVVLSNMSSFPMYCPVTLSLVMGLLRNAYSLSVTDFVHHKDYIYKYATKTELKKIRDTFDCERAKEIYYSIVSPIYDHKKVRNDGRSMLHSDLRRYVYDRLVENNYEHIFKPKYHNSYWASQSGTYGFFNWGHTEAKERMDKEKHKLFGGKR